VTYLASFSATYLATSLNLALLNAWQVVGMMSLIIHAGSGFDHSHNQSVAHESRRRLLRAGLKHQQISQRPTIA